MSNYSDFFVATPDSAQDYALMVLDDDAEPDQFLKVEYKAFTGLARSEGKGLYLWSAI